MYASVPENREQFYEVLSQIDAKLVKDGIPIHARSIHAIGEYSQRFGLALPIITDDRDKVSNVFIGREASLNISVWFRKQYGEKTKIWFGPISTVLLLRGEPWEMKSPRIYGEVHFTISRNLSPKNNRMNVARPGEQLTVNVLDMVVEIQKQYADTLSDIELDVIFNTFINNYICIDAIGNSLEFPLFKEAYSDISAAVKHLLNIPIHCGLSLWASAQASEKCIKSFLKQRTGSFKHTHDLKLIHQQAVDKGMPAVNDELLDMLATTPGVRYGEGNTEIEASVLAHQASLKIGKHIVDSIRGLP